jgi:hypothetical protein
MIRVQEDWKIKLIAHALHQSCDLANSHEGALALGRADEYRKIQLPRRIEDRFQ